MREMTVVVMPCDNNPPKGYISNSAGAQIADSLMVKTCAGNHELAFDINPSDADNGNIISMTVNGLPKDAKINISNNNSTHPTSRFIWSMPSLTDGDYTFFVTYTDDGCPIASKQTQAYTIHIAPDSIASEASASGCTGKGSMSVIVPQSWSPWSYQVYQGSTRIQARDNIVNTTASDSLQPGKYRVQALNYFGCTDDVGFEIPYACYFADIPTAFSPNSDGSNDILFVLGENVQEMSLKIYNRWGWLVFESHDVKTGWDGKYNGGEAPMEAYAYTLSVVFTNKQTFYKKGNVTIIR